MRFTLLATASIGFCTSALLAPASPAYALTGLEIAVKSDQDLQDYKGQRTEATWTLYDPAGAKTVVYKTLQFALEGLAKESGPKTLMRFLAPPDTKGTALLTHEATKGGEDDRWLYLSETKQTKRISGANKSASFKGTEFSYEDLVLSTVDRYSWNLLGDKALDGVACFEVERVPKFENSSYKRSVGYYHKEHFYPLQFRFFDKADQPLKVVKFGQYKQYDGKWRAHLVDMVNVQTKRRTTIEVESYKLGLEIPESVFSTGQLTK